MSSLRSRTGSAVRFDRSPASNGVAPASANGANGRDKNARVERPELSRVPPVPVQEHRVRKILMLIESQPARSIHELAAQFNLSHSHLQHLFKQHTGSRLGHVMLEQRLLKAADLLENSTMSVKEIAYAVGYEHTSSFIRAFERRFAQAPRSYRQHKQPQEMLIPNSRRGTKC